jgi:5-methylthioribose kinase
LANATSPQTGTPLAGGVSSDIWRIDTARSGSVCAKRALPKLRVAADWHAPIARNRYEARWMQVATQAVPGCTPRLLGQHDGLGVLVMEYLDPARHKLWKQCLRDGEVDAPFARSVGDTLARIHGHAARQPELASQFDTDTIFFDIRLDPYLLATAEKHPDLAEALQALVVQTQSHKVALVHGDVSPKNILVGPYGQPVFLDAECAWWGDPAFDLAFCLNHLLLKCLWVPASASALVNSFDALARVDGKSPVEYLTGEPQCRIVRRCASELLRQPVARLVEVAAAWAWEVES